jgi:hypothetical protein
MSYYLFEENRVSALKDRIGDFPLIKKELLADTPNSNYYL